MADHKKSHAERAASSSRSNKNTRKQNNKQKSKNAPEEKKGFLSSLPTRFISSTIFLLLFIIFLVIVLS